MEAMSVAEYVDADMCYNLKCRNPTKQRKIFMPLSCDRERVPMPHLGAALTRTGIIKDINHSGTITAAQSQRHNRSGTITAAQSQRHNHSGTITAAQSS